MTQPKKKRHKKSSSKKKVLKNRDEKSKQNTHGDGQDGHHSHACGRVLCLVSLKAPAGLAGVISIFAIPRAGRSLDGPSSLSLERHS